MALYKRKYAENINTKIKEKNCDMEFFLFNYWCWYGKKDDKNEETSMYISNIIAVKSNKKQ